jgi:hypothetical protein
MLGTPFLEKFMTGIKKEGGFLPGPLFLACAKRESVFMSLVSFSPCFFARNVLHEIFLLNIHIKNNPPVTPVSRFTPCSF